jgi:hypothetical protein
MTNQEEKEKEKTHLKKLPIGDKPVLINIIDLERN